MISYFFLIDCLVIATFCSEHIHNLRNWDFFETDTETNNIETETDTFLATDTKTLSQKREKSQ